MLVWMSGIKLRLFFNVLFQRVGYTFKKDEIEDPMIRRIQSVFQRATIKWKVSAQCVLSCERWEDVCVLRLGCSNVGLWILTMANLILILLIVSLLESILSTIKKIYCITLELFFEDDAENSGFHTYLRIIKLSEMCLVMSLKWELLFSR